MYTTRNIQYNLSRRICTTVADENTKYPRIAESNIFLEAQNYPETFVLSARYCKNS
jgi:hypothetical protein